MSQEQIITDSEEGKMNETEVEYIDIYKAQKLIDE